MSHTISAAVAKAGFVLPTPAAAVGNYVPRLRVGNLLFISGQLPVSEGKPQFLGQVLSMQDQRAANPSRDVDQHPIASCSGDQAVKAAEICALNILAQIAAEVDDDLERVEKLIRLGGFVYAHPAFSEHAKIINGASDLMVAVLGEYAGKHARAATGASSLPFGVPVEIEATVALR